MATIKKLLIVRCFKLPDFVIDIINEYAFVDISVKIQEQRMRKNEVETLLCRWDTIRSYLFSHQLHVFVYKFKSDNLKDKSIAFCRQCGNFSDPKDYQTLALIQWEKRHHLRRYENDYCPRVFKNPFRNEEHIPKIMLCICQRKNICYRENKGKVIVPVWEDYKCDGGYNYCKLLL